MRYLIFILLLSGPALLAQDTDSLPYTWLVEIADSVLEKTTLCDDCLIKPTIKRFVTPQGETQFRYNFSCATDFSSTIIFSESGTILGKCIITETTRDCEDDFGSAFTGFTFGTSIEEIWTCSVGFSCQAQNQLDIFKSYEVLTERLDCESPRRRLTTSEPFFDYTWIDPVGTKVNGVQTIATVSGDYTVIVGDALGCRDTMVVPFDLDDFGVSLQGQQLICGEEGTTLSVSGYESYLWSTGDIDSTVTFDQAGMYSVVATDRLGCRDTAFFNIGDLSRRQVEINANSTPVFENQPSPLEAMLIGYIPDQVASIVWSITAGDLSCRDCLTPSLTTSQESIISVVITDGDGCSQTDTIIVTPLQSYKKAYAGNVFTPNDDNVHDLFYLQSIPGTMEVRSFDIYDRWGSLVHSAPPHLINDTTAAWNGRHHGRPAPAGTYIWVAELSFSDGTVEIMKGSVELIR